MELDYKKKAKQLIDKYINIASTLTTDEFSQEIIAKQCALICIDETITSLRTWENSYMGREQILYFFKIKEELEAI